MWPKGRVGGGVSPSQTDEGVRLSLEVIGIVGVTVSLIFLLITIITFIAFRYAPQPSVSTAEAADLSLQVSLESEELCSHPALCGSRGGSAGVCDWGGAPG